MKQNYFISQKWYSLWTQYKLGGDSPGRLTLDLMIFPEDSADKNTSEFIKIKKSELDFLISKFSEPHSSMNLNSSSLSDACSGSETPRAEISNLKLSNSFRKSCNEKEGSFRMCNPTLSTTQSFKRCYSTISSLAGVQNPKIILSCKEPNNAICSCLILLFNISQFSTYFIDKYYTGLFNNKPLSTLFSQLYLMQTTLKSGRIDTTFIEEFLLDNYPQIHKLRFAEIFGLILNHIIEEYETNDFIIREVFNGSLTREISCLSCFSRQSSEEGFNELQLDVSITIERSLEIFNREGRVNSFCGNCGECKNSSQRLIISQEPAYLILNLKRFVDLPYLHKNDMFCEFKKHIVVNDQSYDIYNVLVHEGDVDEGSFKSFFRFKNKFYEQIGKKAKKVSIDKVLSQVAYVLLYKRR